MQAVFVKGDWMTNVVQPNLIIRFIRKKALAVVHDFTEDHNYNVTLFLKNPCDTCFTELCEEFPQYAFSII